jgi:photosystem II oxygen-evolving enhancer protein 2
MLKRIAVVAVLVLSLALQSCASLGGGFNAYVDAMDGYRFFYPNGWLQVSGNNGPDVVFRDLIEETDNVSVVLSTLTGNRKLSDLGDASTVGLQIAKKILAPEGSNRQAELLSAAERETLGKVYYDLEYLIKIGDRERHHLASVAVSRGKLYTLNISAPEQRWDKVASLYKKVETSFRVD